MTLIIQTQLYPKDYPTWLKDRHLPVLVQLQPNGWWKLVHGPYNNVTEVERPLVLSTIGSRHAKANADWYLMQGTVKPGQGTYDRAYEKMIRLCREFPSAYIHLIYTGLTEVTLAAVFGMIHCRQHFQILRYDTALDGYIPLNISEFYKG